MNAVLFRKKLVMIFPFAALIMLTSYIDYSRVAFMGEKGVLESDILRNVLGENMKILSGYALNKGDEYLHGGIQHTACKLSVNKTEIPGEHNIIGCSDKPATLNILFRLGEATHISEHKHIRGKEERELLPWFYYAVELNPSNVDAYVLGGYWLGQRLDKADEAVKFLREGLSNNPDSWKIYAQLGQIYFVNKKDYGNALNSLNRALILMNDDNADKFDRREIYSFMAASYERLGDDGKALECYKKIAVLDPQDKEIKEKIRSLQ